MPDPKPAYNTVSTVVRVLEGKGFINRKAYGNSHVYFPAVSDDVYKKIHV
jgi:BlaI family penicillinase repressor